VIETLVGAEHHSATGQTFFHSRCVSFLLGQLDLFEAVLTKNGAIRAIGLVVREILAENRSSAISTIGNLELAFLKGEKTNQNRTE
jgi:hypothetical protein